MIVNIIFIVKPLLLSDFQAFGSIITLTEGSLHGISTINRTDNAIISYSPETKDLKVQFPMDLNCLYVSSFYLNF